MTALAACSRGTRAQRYIPNQTFPEFQKTKTILEVFDTIKETGAHEQQQRGLTLQKEL